MKTRSIRRLLIVVAAAVAGLSGAAVASASGQTSGLWSFVSSPGLHPPKLLTQGRVDHAKLGKGDFLLNALPNVSKTGATSGQSGPLIVNRSLQPVWFRSVGKKLVTGDLQQETYQGHPVLVWWQGQLTFTGATLSGEVVVVDQHYRTVAKLTANSPWKISLHDAVISGSDIWVTVYRYVHHENLTPYGGRSNGTVYDAGVQEYDLSTGKLLYTWDALNPGGKPNVPLGASEQPASAAPATGGAWDAYHVNSIQVLGGGQILVSMRNTWAAYLIDTPTGKIVWTLGGKKSSFKFGRGASFAWQHDVRLLPRNEVTLFNDNCCRQLPNGRFAPQNGNAEGMVLRLDPVHRTVSKVATYGHQPPIVVTFLGSMQLLPNHNVLVGFGSRPYFSEFSSSGKQLLDARFPGNEESYRALYTPSWVGTPSYPPAGAGRRSGGRTTVYASWNGATEVARWQVLAGASEAHLSVVATKPKSGFETAIALANSNQRVFEVRALNAAGQVLGTSASFQLAPAPPSFTS